MNTLLLGIDIGTSGIKLGLVDHDARVLATATSPYHVAQPQPGWAEMEPRAWIEGIRAAIPLACDRAGVSPEHIDALGFSAMYPVLVPMGEDLEPLHPGILYCDQRSIAQAETLRQRLPRDRFLALTGNVITPGTCSLTSLVWLREERPEVFRRARYFAHAAGFVAGMLTGRVVTDWVTASLSGVFETGGGYRWSEEICQAAEVPLDRLPELAAPTDCVGALRAEAARELGLRPGIPVAAGAGDTACSALGLGMVQPGEGCVTCGTTDNLTACGDRPTFDPRFANCCHVERDRWLFIATMSNTGAALEWFRTNFASTLADGDGDDYARLFAAAERVPPGAGGVVCLPYWQGERSPVWDPKARAAFLGMGRGTTPAHLLRALLEGVAFALRQNTDAIEELGLAPDHLLLTGGTTKSSVWNQIRADVLGRPLHRVTDAETTLVGAALLAGVAAGLWPTVAEAAAVARCAATYEIVTPSPAAAEYDRLYPLYAQLYPALRDWLHLRHDLCEGSPR